MSEAYDLFAEAYDLVESATLYPAALLSHGGAHLDEYALQGMVTSDMTLHQALSVLIKALYDQLDTPPSRYAAIPKEVELAMSRASQKTHQVVLKTKADQADFIKRGWGNYQIVLSKQDLQNLLEDHWLGNFDDEYTHMIRLDPDISRALRDKLLSDLLI
ncbi:hypothetical protein [Lacticaseibacillus porcinae]|uniref:hypothetical protein n=1 Tax=Lacticaseibacillus porcinae TaxID=1123687 RepID=UPI000F769D41|nr:hypothetical protein [Lacticaseibacillus porcinae]